MINYQNLQIENDRLFKQNSVLIKKLEQITMEFGKSQTKLKVIDSKGSNQTCVSGNFNKLLDQIKILESDNRRLCEELHHQISNENINDTNSRVIDLETSKQLAEIKALKSNSQEKITNLKNHIRELQKQLVKTQKIAFENECNSKECQIETLEALKYCEMEKNSLANKISELEEKAKNMLTLHQENFELKTSLNRANTEMQSTHQQCTHLAERISKSEKSVKEMDHELRCMIKKLELSQQKVDQLTSENQCLLNSLEQQTTSTPQSITDHCDQCINKSALVLSIEEDLQTMVVKLNSCNKEKEEMNNRHSEQIAIITQFEEEQKKLRIELNNLANNSSKYEALFKSKDDEIENLTCQLTSVQQRLELRDQRVSELSDQLQKAVSEEKQCSSNISKLTEKIKVLEAEQSSSQQELIKSKKENNNLSEKTDKYKKMSSKSDEKIEELRSQLQEKEKLMEEVNASLDKSNSLLKMKTNEFTSTITSLDDKIEQLNYSIGIYESQNQKLDENLKLTQEELQSVKRDSESHRLELDRTQIQLEKDREIMEQHLSDIRIKCSEVEELRGQKYELERELCEKNKEMDLSISQHEFITKQLIDLKTELNDVSRQKHQLEQESFSNQQTKSELNERIKENKKLKHNLSELTLRLDIVSRNLSEEKERFLSEESKHRDMVTQLETMQFKFTFMEEELDRKRNILQDLEENKRLELRNNLDKLRSVEKERDDVVTKLCASDDLKNRSENERKMQQQEISELQRVINMKTEELKSQNQFCQGLERQMVALQENVKCGQQTIVERSREIDRLDQLVRDRSQLIEVRSNQLQEFQIDLENKLKEMQSQLSEAKEKENKFCMETVKITTKYDELLDKYNSQSRLLAETLRLNKDKEEEIAAIKVRDKQLEIENKSSVQNLQLMKDELSAKILVVNDLLKQIRRKDKELEDVTERLESMKSVVTTKEFQIKQNDEQLKKSRSSFTETEAKLKGELKSAQRKMESLERELNKSNEKMGKQHKSECQKYRDKVSLEAANVERLSNEMEAISTKLVQSQEEIVRLKIDIETHKSVLIDTENNCRLKGVVIERLLAKLNMDSLKSYGEQINDLASVDVVKLHKMDNERSYGEIYEEVSLQELIGRITKKLECE